MIDDKEYTMKDLLSVSRIRFYDNYAPFTHRINCRLSIVLITRGMLSLVCIIHIIQLVEKKIFCK
jgi:hypothetical protein